MTIAMSRKRPIEDPPPASSEEEGDEEEVSSEENNSAEDDDDDQDDEEEEVKTPVKTPLNKRQTVSGKGGSDSESDSDKSLPSPNVSDFTIKPIATKPQKSAPKSTPKPKPTATESSSKRKNPPSSSSNGAAANVKSPGGPRLWSEADEIAILKSMIEFKSKKGADPYADSSGFHDFIKQSIQADVSKNQLMEKIRRLKKKYKTNAEKGQNGNDPAFSKPHDHKAYELSKKIWGNETNEKSNKSKKKVKTLESEDQDKSDAIGGVTLGLPCFKKDKEANAKVSTQVSYDSEKEKVDFWKDFPCLKESFKMGKYGHVGDFLMKSTEDMVGVIGREKLNCMERDLRKLRVRELELYLKRIELVQEQATAALEVFKGSDF